MSENNKSYRIRTEINPQDNYKIPIKLDRDYDVIEILSLKLSQENFYKLHTSNYGVLVGRVVANGGIGISNAKISIFIPVTSETRLNYEKFLLYPYDSVQSQDSNNIRYNLLPNSELNECYKVVGTFPSKRIVLDNNNVLEVFDEYFKYTTVTNQAGDYMIYNLPLGDNLLHIDIDLSDIGILSQKPIDMFYKGYNIKQFESSSQFKSDTNLDNLTQIISQTQNVFVYPFWGSDEENDIAITRCDINVQYKFEPTCIFMGSIFTDQQEAVVQKQCKIRSNIGRMSSLITGEGTIEMIRKTFDGSIENLIIDGNRLVDGDGVFCYQIPMNLDYITTDEFGNFVLTDNPNKGIPTRAEVRFRISLDNVGDDGYTKKRGKYLVPHNPQNEDEIDYDFGVNTKDISFVNLFWNKIYSVKSYIPRLQLIGSYRTREFMGLKTINNYNNNNPTPYNTLYIRMPIIFSIMCFITTLIITIVSFINGLFSQLRCMSCRVFGVNVCGVIGGIFSFLRCLETGSGWCYYSEKISAPNCTCRHLIGKIGKAHDVEVNVDTIKNCVITSLAEDNEVFNFDFSNDWLNGSLYSPLFQIKNKKKKKRKFFGLFGSKVVGEVLQFCGNITTPDGNSSNAAQGGWLFGRGVASVRLLTNCSIRSVRNGNNWSYNNNINPHCENNNCFRQIDEMRLSQGFVNQITDENGKIHYYYIPSVFKSNNGIEFPVYFFATDIILIGSLNNCDVDGIYQLHKYLPSSSYKLPSPLKDIGEYTDDTINNDNTNDSKIPSQTEASGINWGKGGGQIGSDQRPGDGGFWRDSTSGGLFMGIECTESNTTYKSCINVVRLCEVGVSLDISDIRIDNCSQVDDTNTNKVVAPDGWILKDDMEYSEVRQMFATLNSVSFNNREGNIVNFEGRKYYNFKYSYPENFDGKLFSLLGNNTKWTNKKNEIYDDYYYKFRFGYNNIREYYGTNNTLPRYNNSFYFYFGLISGKTAIDKFRSNFFTECILPIKDDFIVMVQILTSALVCVCDASQIEPVKFEVVIREFGGSYSINITDFSNIPISLTPSVVSGLVKNTLTFSSSSGPGVDFYSSNFQNGGTFILTVEDDNGLEVKRQINIPIRGFVDFEFNKTKEIVGNLKKLECSGSCNNNSTCVCCSDYITVPSSLSNVNNQKGVLNITNIFNVKQKGCSLSNYNLIIQKSKVVGTGLTIRISANSSGVITGVTLVNGGTGYITGNNISIPGGSGGTFTINSVNNSGTVISISVGNGGSNYETTPSTDSISLDNINVNLGSITYTYGNNTTWANICNAFDAGSGSGYTSGSIISIPGGSGGTLMIDSVDTNGGIINCSINSAGSGYTSGSVVLPAPTGGASAGISMITGINGIITSVDLNINFNLYFCAGNYNITLQNTNSACNNDKKIITTFFIEQEPLVLTFGGDIRADYFNFGSIGNTDTWWYNEAYSVSTPSFYHFLMDDSKNTANDLAVYYNDILITDDVVPSFKAILRNNFISLCDNSQSIMLSGRGYTAPYLTLLFGRKYVDNVAPEAQDNASNVNAKYKTTESMLEGNWLGVNPSTNSSYGVKLTYTTSSSLCSDHEPGGYYAGIIGDNGLGVGNTQGLNEAILNIRGGDPTIQIGINDVWNYGITTPNTWNTFAPNALFLFHIFDKQFKFNNMLSRNAAYKQTYVKLSDGTDSDPLYGSLNVVYFNGPKTDLTWGLDPNDEFTISITPTIPVKINNSGLYGTNTNTLPFIRSFYNPYVAQETTIDLGTIPPVLIPGDLPFIEPSSRVFGNTYNIQLIYDPAEIESPEEGSPPVTQESCDIELSLPFDLGLSNSNVSLVTNSVCNGNNLTSITSSLSITLTASINGLNRYVFYLINMNDTSKEPEVVLYPEPANILTAYYTEPVTSCPSPDNTAKYIWNVDSNNNPIGIADFRMEQELLSLNSVTFNNIVLDIFNSTSTPQLNTYKYYGIVYDKTTGMRAFSQPLDLGNYLVINAFTYNISTNTYTIEVEVKGSNSLVDSNYTYFIEQGFYSFDSDGNIIFNPIVDGIPSTPTPTPTYTFNNVTLDAKTIGKIIKIYVKDRFNTTFIIYTSAFDWIDESNTVCEEITVPGAQQTYTIAYQTAALDCINSVKFDNNGNIVTTYQIVDGITLANYLANGKGKTSGDLPQCT